MDIINKYYPCPCCGSLTRSEEEYGTFEICDVCGWEDDFAQAKNPDFEGGANKPSLNQAKENYKNFGKISMDKISTRKLPK
ncbi:MAG: hydrolase [Oligoflexia bacterium]|nr:hydrolase [Oligoflexia bacterium]MBF0364526.1 hydrolase [Oligoflexia bacterium]